MKNKNINSEAYLLGYREGEKHGYAEGVALYNNAESMFKQEKDALQHTIQSQKLAFEDRIREQKNKICELKKELAQYEHLNKLKQDIRDFKAKIASI